MIEENRSVPFWGALVLEVPEEREEELVSVLARGTLGARIGDARGGRIRIEVFLASPADADRAWVEAALLLRCAGLDPAVCGLRKTEVADGAWVEAYQAGLEPFRLGSRFIVQPGEREVATGELDPIALAPAV